MPLKRNFEILAQYNQEMNRSIYAAASKLSTVDLARDQGAFFGSITNTLNHILVGDTIWLQRFAGHKEHLPSLDYVRSLPRPTSLDRVLYPGFGLLRESREEMDGVIRSFVAELTASIIGQPFSYVNTKGTEFSKNFGHVLQHLFNHQTHHRGQVSTLLYQQGIDVGVTDLLVNIPNPMADVLGKFPISHIRRQRQAGVRQ